MTRAIPVPPRRRGRAGRWPAALASLTLLTGAATAGLTGAAAAAAPGGFAPGDVVVYRVGDGSGALSGAGSPVFLDEYDPSGALVRSVPLPTTGDGANHPLVASGSATSEGGLTLSGDGNYLVATGYATAVGATGLSSSAAVSVPRTVARVDASGAVDTSTALTDFSDGNNPRSAVSEDGREFWAGGAAGGVRYAPLGASTSTAIVSSTYKNVRQLSITGGQLYTSADPTKAGVTVAAVGSDLPTTATQPVTNLPFATPPPGPYAYALLTLGTGSGPDTLYVADNAAQAVVKYGLTNGQWVQQGSVAVPDVTGVTADDDHGTVHLYATSSGDDGTAGTLYGLTDASGIGGTFGGSATVLADAPAGEAFRGVAFAPGTVIGSGGGTPAGTVPTVTTDQGGLPAALGDETNPALKVTVGDDDVPADDLTVTATSSNSTVAPDSGISVTGSGAERTLTVTPAAVGHSTITVTATAPDGSSASTQVSYAVSADLGKGVTYHSGAGNASAAVDVGDGYLLVADDESNVLRLYDGTRSGPPVRTFDFSSQLPDGTAEADLETAARAGDTIYWGGSMSNNDDGTPEPSRSTVFATRITGSGADTRLTYAGAYTGLQSDLVAWDKADGHGLGANYLGLADSVQGGIGGHESDALNLEGMEFAPGSTSTAYLAFRAPLEPATDRHLALVVPLTDLDTLVGSSGSAHATFGKPILMDLGGLGVRDIRRNADGQYLIVAGTADGTNDRFVLHSWDGEPSDPPIATGTTLPVEPAGDDHGAWETVVDVPDPLTAGAPVRLLQDDGDTAWYGDGRTSKSGLPADLQKSLDQTLTYTPGPRLATGLSLSGPPSAPVTGQSVTFTANVTGPAGSLGTPTGTVDFTSAGTEGCADVPVTDAGTASCTLAFPAAGTASVTASYSGDASFAPASGTAKATVAKAATRTTVTSGTDPVPYGSSVTLHAAVTAVAPGGGAPDGSVVFTERTGGRNVRLACGSSGSVPLAGGTAQCTVRSQDLGAPGTYTVTAAYGGSAGYTASTGAFDQRIGRETSTTRVTATPSAVRPGGAVLVTVGVTPGDALSLLRGGSVSVSVRSASGKAVPCLGVMLPGTGGVCVVPAGLLTASAGPYRITADFAGNALLAPSTGSATVTVSGKQ